WGLAEAGDIQGARAAFFDLLSVYVSGAGSVSFYLEGKEGDNIRLNRAGAMLAAACGEAHTAGMLLQYLENAQAQDTLITALTAGALLQNCYALPASAALKTSYVFQRVEIEGLNDACLKLTGPGPVNLENISGDIGYVIIRR
ncbi:MAG: hypothetical protein FWG06_01700, partial [Clostridiales bacterium]|nr:hypothetical protein [Clostridiales bacterium]